MIDDDDDYSDYSDEDSSSEDDDEKETSRRTTGWATAAEAIEETPPRPREDFDLLKLEENKKYFDEAIARKLLNVGFFSHPHMTDLIVILREINYIQEPKCPNIEITLIASMLEFAVAYVDRKKTRKDLVTYIEFIHSQWLLVGKYINMGETPNGSLLLQLLAFCTFECIDYTDGVNKMKPDNHTLKWSDCNIFKDYLEVGGYPCSKDESQQFSSNHTTKADTWIESGLIKKGNKWGPYKKQVNARYETTCTLFKDRLKIQNGPSVIDGVEHTHYEGVHIVAAAGLLNLVLAALLTVEMHGKPPHVVVLSVRARRLLFNCENHIFDVVAKNNQFIVLCPYIHPNSHQMFLDNYTDEERKKLDKSYSTAFSALHGKEIIVAGSKETFKAARVYSTSQRHALQAEVRNLDGIDPKDKALLRQIKELDKLVKRKQKMDERLGSLNITDTTTQDNDES